MIQSKDSPAPRILTPAEAGDLLRRRRNAIALTQAQVVARSTVPTTQYLTNLESGRVSPARSKHLLSLAQVLGLTPADLAPITGVQVPPQPVNIYTPTLLNMASHFANPHTRPAAVRMETESRRFYVMDPQQTDLVSGHSFAVLLHDHISAFRARCVRLNQELLLAIDDAIHDPASGTVIVLGRLTHVVEEL